MKKTYKYTAPNGEDYQIRLEKGTYFDGSLGLTMVNALNGEDYATLTVNLGMIEQDETHAFVDTNNLGGDIIKWLQDNKIAKYTGKIAQSGFCTYPLFEFKI